MTTQPEPQRQGGSHLCNNFKGQLLSHRVYRDYKEHIRIILMDPSRLPQRIRTDVISRIRTELLPALLESIDSLCDQVDMSTIEDEDIQFEFVPARERVKKIEQISADLADSVNSVRDQLTLERTSYPEFMQPTTDKEAAGSDSEPIEELSYFTWTLLIRRIHYLLLNLVHMFQVSSPPWHPNNLTRNLFAFVKRFQRDIRKTSEMIGLSDLEIYMHEWERMAQSLKTHLDLPPGLDSYAMYLLLRDRGGIDPSPRELRQSAQKSIIPIVRLTMSLVNKTSGRMKHDPFLTKKMNVTQLETLARHIGWAWEKETAHGRHGGRFFSQNIVSLESQIAHVVYLGPKSPNSLLNHPNRAEVRIPGRNLLLELEKCFLGIFQVINKHFDQLIPPEPSHSTTLSDCCLVIKIQESRAWCKTWKLAYNVAVKHYLDTYKELYGPELNDTWFQEAVYYGKDLD